MIENPSATKESASGGTAAFAVAAEDAGLRLDRFLAQQMAELSRTRIQTLMDEGRVLVNGEARKPSYRMAEGDTVRVEMPEPPQAGVEAEEIPLDVLYEDADLAVLNKPAGMIVHPGAGADAGTLVAALLHRYGGMSGLSTVGGPLRPGIVHRLDKGTSGAIVVALNDEAHKKLVEEFRTRRVKKTYVALLHGRLKGEAGVVDLPVARDLRRRSRMTARRSEGRTARTSWRVRLRLGGYTLIEADLHTGRTHQIRVHFSALNYPVVGDTLYGAPKRERIVAGAKATELPELGRNFLHAARIGFEHPRTGAAVTARAPLAAELATYLRGLGAVTGTAAGLIDAALGEFL
jgi:23S rRNA pseudouridine1911/1915/1917 synthase